MNTGELIVSKNEGSQKPGSVQTRQASVGLLSV